MNIHDLYKDKVRTVTDAINLIHSEDFIIAGLGGSEPIDIMSHLHLLKENNVKNCEFTNCLPMGNYEFFQDEKYKDVIDTTSWFYTGAMRKAHSKKISTFVPQHLHLAFTKRKHAIEDRRLVLLTTCSPMDNHGYLSLSLGCTFERDVIETGAVVIVEVNPNFPRTFGDTHIHISEIDCIVESTRDIPVLPEIPLNDKDRKIGNFVADLIEDGSTIQLGIGGIPNAVAEALKSKKHLGIHTEMFTDGMVDLIQSGAVDNSMKTLYKGKSVATFALGSKKLYDFLDDNPSVELKHGKWTNNPYIIGQNHKMVSINTTIEIDLTGQCASESIGHTQISGTGGQSDTAVGAQICEEGKSFITLYSTAQIKNPDGTKETVSKITPCLKPGASVSLSRNDVDYVVTEYGVVWLRGRSGRKRALSLIEIAHPDFREELRRSAEEMNLI